MPDEISSKNKQQDENNSSKERLRELASANTGLSLNQKLTLIGAPILVLLAIFIHDPYNKYYVFPLQERTFLPKIDLQLNRLAWRLVDSDNFFTLGSHHPQSIKLGLAWKSNEDSNSTARLSASSIPSYQWLETDGSSFGKLVAFDDFGTITVDFVIQKKSFIVRIQPQMDIPTVAVDFFIYVISSNDDILRLENDVVYGYNSLIGNFTLQLQSSAEGNEVQLVDQNMFLPSSYLGPNKKALVLKFPSVKSTQYQLALNPEGEKEISFADFESIYESGQSAFNTVFDVVYNLKSQNFPGFYQSMGKSALAQVFSSEQYSFEKHLASGLHNSKFETEQIELLRLASTENVSVWNFDEQLFSLMGMVDINPSGVMNIITTWFNLINEQHNLPIRHEGETLAYGVPQSPIFLFILQKLKSQNINIDTISNRLAEIINRMRSNLASFEENVYSWKSVPAFLGNTPRPDRSQQANLDLHCWMTAVSRLSGVGNGVDLQAWNQIIDNPEYLIRNYYNEATKMFEDAYITEQNGKKTKNFFSIGNGNINLLPLMFRLLPHDSQYITDLINSLENSEEIWTPYGVRSLSKTSTHYEEAVPDRGAISIASNYMILGGLHHYAQQSGPNQQAAHILYSKLRNAIIANVAIEFKKTKFFWDYYSDVTGKGMGARRHNWSALILQIMAGKF